MKIAYTVHTVGFEKHPVEVTHEGATITADVETMVVELVSDDEAQKNHMIRIPPAERADAEKIFKPGAHVEATFTAKGKSK